MPIQSPLCTACEKCGLWKTHPGETPTPILQDSRNETLAGAYDNGVLFVHSYPSQEDGDQFLRSDCTEWMLDFLGESKFEWAFTALNLCYPGHDGKRDVKPKAGQIRECTSTFLEREIAEFDPQVIVALGGEALKALWPASRGTPPAISKARLMPVKEGGRWLVTTYDPKLHGY